MKSLALNPSDDLVEEEDGPEESDPQGVAIATSEIIRKAEVQQKTETPSVIFTTSLCLSLVTKDPLAQDLVIGLSPATVPSFHSSKIISKV